MTTYDRPFIKVATTSRWARGVDSGSNTFCVGTVCKFNIMTCQITENSPSMLNIKWQNIPQTTAEEDLWMFVSGREYCVSRQQQHAPDNVAYHYCLKSVKVERAASRLRARARINEKRSVLSPLSIIESELLICKVLAIPHKYCMIPPICKKCEKAFVY